jgi:hypothetical protein
MSTARTLAIAATASQPSTRRDLGPALDADTARPMAPAAFFRPGAFTRSRSPIRVGTSR